jgi:hypothetical protein
MNWSHGTSALNQSFSGVCWLFGRDLYNKLNGSVPIGLIGAHLPDILSPPLW